MKTLNEEKEKHIHHIQSFELVSNKDNKIPEPISSLLNITKQIKSYWRWLAIPFVGVLQFTNYICYYNPQPLQTTLLKPPMNLSSTEYNILFSIYSFPNIIMTPVGGWLIDKKGLYFSMVLFVVFMIIGQSIILIFGGLFNSYGLILLGRFISGIGSENLSMAQKVILANWFVGNERIFAYGTNTSFAQMAIIMTSSFVPIIYESAGNNYFYPYLFSFLVAVLALISSIIIIYLDKKIIKKQIHAPVELKDEEIKSNEKKSIDENEKIEDITPNMKKQLIEEVIKSDMSDSKMIKCSDLKLFGPVFWLLVFSNYLSYGSFFTFIDNANDLLVKNYGYNFKEAGNVLTFIFIISSIASPLFGYILKNIGRKMLMMFVSLILFLFSLSFLIIIELTNSNEMKIFAILSLILTGLFYAMNFSLIWTCISMVVNKNKMGSAFGIVYSSRNINLVISPLIAGLIHDKTQSIHGGYLYLLVFLFFQIVLAIILTVEAAYLDHNGKRILV